MYALRILCRFCVQRQFSAGIPEVRNFLANAPPSDSNAKKILATEVAILEQNFPFLKFAVCRFSDVGFREVRESQGRKEVVVSHSRSINERTIERFFLFR